MPVAVPRLSFGHNLVMTSEEHFGLEHTPLHLARTLFLKDPLLGLND